MVWVILGCTLLIIICLGGGRMLAGIIGVALLIAVSTIGIVALLNIRPGL